MTFQESIEAVIKTSMNEVHAKYTKRLDELETRLLRIEELIVKASKAREVKPK